MEDVHFNVQQDILYKLHPEIRRYVLYIWQQDKLGSASAENILILKPSSSMKKNEAETVYANKFTVMMPYAGQFLVWEIKFSNDDMNFAPDLRMVENSFIGQLTPDEVAIKIPSWKNWDPKNPSSLYSILIDFLILHRNNEIRKLEALKFSRLHFEFAALLEGTPLKNDEIEVSVNHMDIVSFLIKLKINFSKLPKEFFKLVTDKPSASLLIVFPYADGSKAQPEVYFTPAVNRDLLDFENKQLPSFPSDGCLMDYVPLIQNFLQDKIQLIIDNHNLKQSYIAYLLAHHAKNVLEHNQNNYTKATLLFNTNGFYWLLVIVISNNFPKEKPQWTMRSIYHTSYDEPITDVLLDYPYSPRWSVDEMIKRALKYSIEKIPQFQKKK